MSTETITISLQEYNALIEEIRFLREEIRLLKNGRNSKTSSTPPSQDIGRSNRKSLREPSIRKTGGQPDHGGTNLKMKETPDEIIKHCPDYCKQCGKFLKSEDAIIVSRNQEIVLPPIVPYYIEHQSYACTCKTCGFVTTAELPEHLKANVQYGSQISAWVAYLSVRQYMSYERIAEMMRDCFHLPISEGTIDNMLKRLTEKSQFVYEEIKRRVLKSPVIGGDETGIKINGNKAWLWTFQTPLLTFLSVSSSRGYETITNLFKNGFPISIYVTDCWAAQLKVTAKAKQICIAHLLRELNNFIDACKCEWSVKMKQLLKEAISLKSRMQNIDYVSPNEKVKNIQQQLDELLLAEITDKHRKIRAFIKRLNKNHDAILTFLYYPKVPPDNNASERAIRNAKVKMKVSNQFKIQEGAHRFAVLRSVMDTAMKNSQNVLDALYLLPNFAAE